ncbi:MAG: [protein-PII] uridylyltransferase [Polyangiales bacterium]
MTSPDALTRLHLATHVAPLHAAAWRGEGGLSLARALADAHDALLRVRFDETARHAPAPSRVALVALGGYGRGALAPGSDLDLMLLTDDDPLALQGVAEHLLLPLWDARVSLGHAVRSVDELGALARDDLRTATSVLDARPLAGDLDFARASLARLRAAALGDVDGFVARLGDEMAARHARYGGSVYLLEPEVKHTRGGLRDLDLARWAMAARWGALGFDDAARRHILGDADRARFEAAAGFVWRLRGAMHRRPGHRADRLTFDEQEECAARLGFVDPARRAQPETRDAAAVEGASALMSQWYRHARDVATLVEQVLDLARAPRTARADGPQLEDVAPEVARVGDLLGLARRDSLQRDPGAALRLLEEALARGLALTPSSRAAVLAASRDPRWCEALRGDPRTGPAFLRLLTHSAAAALRAPGQRAVSSAAENPGSVLAVVHDLGLLLAVIPEFEAVTARVQHDVYHVYTVDVHSVAAVDHLHALARGEHADALPQATARLADLDRRDLLCLATLLHDVGKAHGRHHARAGALMAGPIARRLGLGDDDADAVAWLVQEHLTLYHVATRRDLGDPDTTARFADLARHPWRLDALYLLTVADLSTTSPTAMTAWKARVLEELYARVAAALRGRPEVDHDHDEALVAQALGETTGDERAALERFLRRMPARYLRATSPARLLRHAQRLGGLDAGARAVCVESLPGDASGTLLEVVVAAPDRPGLLSLVAATLHAHRLDVHHAEIHTRGDAAVDVFTARAPVGRPVDPAGLERTLRGTLDGLLDGALDPAALVRGEGGGGWSRAEPPVAQKVRAHAEASASATVLEVFGRDRPGLLYAITRALHEAGVVIHLAKVNTEGRRVADVFYVTERDGAKLDGARCDAVRAVILGVLG